VSARFTIARDIHDALERLSALHRRVCPRQVLGVRMGLHARERLDVRPTPDERRLLAIVETDGCFADGVSVATGCSLGRRSLRLIDQGKVATTVVDLWTGRAIRLSPHPLVRASASAYAPAAASPWQAQLLAYRVMPVDELLRTEAVEVSIPLTSLVGPLSPRRSCAACGEEVLDHFQATVGDLGLCRGCAGQAYFTRAAAVREGVALAAFSLDSGEPVSANPAGPPAEARESI
jgi:formylmethanofuran dehydrogenase subunit E